MSQTSTLPRESAEARFERIRKVAANLTESELEATRKKTANLRALRLQSATADRQPS